MREIELQLSPNVRGDEVESLLNQAVTQAGLCIKLCGTLKKCPGSIHWHLKLGRERGTLEITYWPAVRRAWFTVQDGRQGAWIDDKVLELQKLIGT